MKGLNFSEKGLIFLLRYIAHLFSVLLIFVAILFVIGEGFPHPLKLTSKELLLTLSFIIMLIGLFSAWLYGIKERFGLKKQIKSLMKEAREKDNELNSLRNLPVTTDQIISDQTTEEE